MAIIVKTVSDLIAELQKLDGATIPISHEPPFTGVQIVPQEDGKVYIASLWNSAEGRAYRAASKHQPTPKRSA